MKSGRRRLTVRLHLNRQRTGFTLIELLMVVTIIAILAGLLLPVIGAAQRRGQTARTLSEIHMLETAIAQFRTRYGVYPPSRIHLRENGKYGNLGTLGPVPTRTWQYLARVWPRLNRNAPVDFDGDGVIPAVNSEVRLNGSECLVFFLGGMPMPYVPDGSGGENLLSIVKQSNPGVSLDDVTTRGLDGFCQNEALPFTRSTDVLPNGVPVPMRDKRNAPLFEFDPARLSDVDLDGYWEYYPPGIEPPKGGAFDPRLQPHPYVYLSGYDGQGYNLVITATGQLRVTHDAAWGPLQQPIGLRWPISRNDFGATVQTVTTSPSLIQWWNPQGFQIIAPGTDGLIGTGTGPGEISVFNPDQDISTLSEEMLDDLTNFSAGSLEESK
jgi:prepilin-type N-terminal cleavage/methylation domain-containing protein